MTDDELRAIFELGFNMKVVCDPRDYIEKMLAGMFGRQPHMSGDQRKRLMSKEKLAVECMAEGIIASITAAYNHSDKEEIDS